MTIHKRCEKNVAKNCGTNTKDLAERLKELGLFGKKVIALVLAVVVFLHKFLFFIACKLDTDIGNWSCELCENYG